MLDRDASVFHRYTAFLARRAGGIVVRWTAFGGLLGGVLGAVTLTHWAKWPVSHHQGYLVAVLGAVCGAFLGRAIGSGRAQTLLFQAQLAQHQLEFERRLLEVSAAVAAQPQPQPVVEAPPAAEPEPQPQPQLEAVFLPEPQLASSHEFALPELPQLSDPEPPVVPQPEPEPVAAEPAPAALAPGAAFALQLPEPFVSAPVASEPEPAPAPGSGDVVPFVPRPEPTSEPEPAAVAPSFAPAASSAPSVFQVGSLASVGVPPLSGDVSAAPAPSAPAVQGTESDPDGYGWWRPGVNGQ